MRRRIILAGFVSLLPATSIGADAKKQKTLREKLEGRWSRPNYPLYFEVQGTKWTEFSAANPFVPGNSGTLTYPKDKDYAVVNASSGHVLRLYLAGDNVVAVETFKKDGTIEENGRIFYRGDAVMR